MRNNINQRLGRLGRPKIRRRIRFHHKINYFKPRSIPIRSLKIIELSVEGLEALRLKNIENLNQTKCAKKMNISQSTFQRILNIAYKKISIALVEGEVIKISDKNFES